MLEMLKARRASLREQGKKGFTLMEMLIVIAIIAILIAIAIPVFTQQLARANAGTDESNIRSGFAQVQSDIMLNNLESASGNVAYTLLENGQVARDEVTLSGGKKIPALNQGEGAASPYTASGSSSTLTGSADNTDVDVSGISAKWSEGQIINYTYAPPNATDADGSYTIAGAAASGNNG